MANRGWIAGNEKLFAPEGNFAAMEIEKFFVSSGRAGSLDSDKINISAARGKKSRAKKVDIYKTVRNYVLREKFSVKWRPGKGRAKFAAVFVVDSSGSMAAGKQISNVKKIIGETVKKNRGKTIKFAGVAILEDRAQVFSPAGTGPEKLIKNLTELKTGGRTNMSAAIVAAEKILRGIKRKNSNSAAIYIFTDGRINFCENSENPFEDSVKKFKDLLGKSAAATVVDTEAGFVKIGAAKKFAEAIGANYKKTGTMREQ